MNAICTSLINVTSSACRDALCQYVFLDAVFISRALASKSNARFFFVKEYTVTKINYILYETTFCDYLHRARTLLTNRN